MPYVKRLVKKDCRVMVEFLETLLAHGYTHIKDGTTLNSYTVKGPFSEENNYLYTNNMISHYMCKSTSYVKIKELIAKFKKRSYGYTLPVGTHYILDMLKKDETIREVTFLGPWRGTIIAGSIGTMYIERYLAKYNLSNKLMKSIKIACDKLTKDLRQRYPYHKNCYSREQIIEFINSARVEKLPSSWDATLRDSIYLNKNFLKEFIYRLLCLGYSHLYKMDCKVFALKEPVPKHITYCHEILSFIQDRGEELTDALFILQVKVDDGQTNLKEEIIEISLRDGDLVKTPSGPRVFKKYDGNKHKYYTYPLGMNAEVYNLLETKIDLEVYDEINPVKPRGKRIRLKEDSNNAK